MKTGNGSTCQRGVTGATRRHRFVLRPIAAALAGSAAGYRDSGASGGRRRGALGTTWRKCCHQEQLGIVAANADQRFDGRCPDSVFARRSATDVAIVLQRGYGLAWAVRDVSERSGRSHGCGRRNRSHRSHRSRGFQCGRCHWAGRSEWCDGYHRSHRRDRRTAGAMGTDRRRPVLPASARQVQLGRRAHRA